MFLIRLYVGLDLKQHGFFQAIQNIYSHCTSSTPQILHSLQSTLIWHVMISELLNLYIIPTTCQLREAFYTDYKDLSEVATALLKLFCGHLHN